MFPLNTLFYLAFRKPAYEKQMEYINRKVKRESEQSDSEQEQLVSHSRAVSPNLGVMRGAQHTGFAFSGEEGHVPQITEKLEGQKKFDQDE